MKIIVISVLLLTIGGTALFLIKTEIPSLSKLSKNGRYDNSEVDLAHKKLRQLLEKKPQNKDVLDNYIEILTFKTNSGENVKDELAVLMEKYPSDNRIAIEYAYNILYFPSNDNISRADFNEKIKLLEGLHERFPSIAKYYARSLILYINKVKETDSDNVESRILDAEEKISKYAALELNQFPMDQKEYMYDFVNTIIYISSDHGMAKDPESALSVIYHLAEIYYDDEKLQELTAIALTFSSMMTGADYYKISYIFETMINYFPENIFIAKKYIEALAILRNAEENEDNVSYIENKLNYYYCRFIREHDETMLEYMQTIDLNFQCIEIEEYIENNLESDEIEPCGDESCLN